MSALAEAGPAFRGRPGEIVVGDGPDWRLLKGEPNVFDGRLVSPLSGEIVAERNPKSGLFEPVSRPRPKRGNVRWEVHDADGKLTQEGVCQNSVTQAGKAWAVDRLTNRRTTTWLGSNFTVIGARLRGRFPGTSTPGNPRVMTRQSVARADSTASGEGATITCKFQWTNSGQPPSITGVYATMPRVTDQQTGNGFAFFEFEEGERPDVGQGATLTVTWVFAINYFPSLTYDPATVSGVKDSNSASRSQLWVFADGNTPGTGGNVMDTIARLLHQDIAFTNKPTIFSLGNVDLYKLESSADTSPYDIIYESRTNFSSVASNTGRLAVDCVFSWSGATVLTEATDVRHRWFQLLIGSSRSAAGQLIPFAAGYLPPQTAYPAAATEYTVGLRLSLS